MVVAAEKQSQEAFFDEVRTLFHRIRVIPDEELLRSLPTSFEELKTRDRPTNKVVITGDIVSKAEVTAVLRHETKLMNLFVEIIEGNARLFQMNRLSPSIRKLKLPDSIKLKLTQIAAAIKKDKNYGTVQEKNARAKKIGELKKGMTPGQIIEFGNTVRVGVKTALELRTKYDEIVSNTCRLRAAREMLQTLKKYKFMKFAPRKVFEIYVRAVNMDPRMKAHAALLNERKKQRVKVLKLRERGKPIPKELRLPPRSQMRHK